ncbi:MAG: DUF5662 family protein [Bradymonadaceae bacterium]
MNEYDSRPDTIEHIRKVRSLLLEIDRELVRRALEHDQTKLEEPEKPIYDEFTPKLEDTEYDSEEYEQYLEQMGEALEHHYDEYRHHPEHFENGIEDMHLLDLLEMIVDWTAAVERHDDDNDIYDSIEANSGRFGYGSEVKQIFENTADWLQEIS